MLFISLDVPVTATRPTWSPQEDYVAFVGEGVYLVATAVGQSRALPNLQATYQLAWRPGSSTLAVALSEGTIRLIEAAAGEGETISPPYPEVRALRGTPQGTYLSWVTEQDVIVLMP
jgi:hypothetical protein